MIHMFGKAKRPLDIFSVLRRLDVGDLGVYGSITDEAAKKELDGFVGFPALRWMSAAEGPRSEVEYCLEAVNEIANPGYFQLGQHRELQCKLLATAGVRKKMRHCWIAGPKRKKTDAWREPVSQMWPHLSDAEIDQWISMNGRDGVVDVAEACGWPPEEIKKLTKGVSDDGA